MQKNKTESKIKTGISYKNHHQKKNSNTNPVYIYISFIFLTMALKSFKKIFKCIIRDLHRAIKKRDIQVYAHH